MQSIEGQTCYGYINNVIVVGLLYVTINSPNDMFDLKMTAKSDGGNKKMKYPFCYQNVKIMRTQN